MPANVDLYAILVACAEIGKFRQVRREVSSRREICLLSRDDSSGRALGLALFTSTSPYGNVNDGLIVLLLSYTAYFAAGTAFDHLPPIPLRVPYPQVH